MKIDVIINGEKKGMIENTTDGLQDLFVLVRKKDISRLKDIHYFTIEDNYFLVKQGRKKKKFNKIQVEQIQKDLNNMSIRNCAKKHNCSTATIQKIKANKY